ncbi:MAG: hypothetical protein H7839_19180 [Magnetococcus sp. YQC-5]
MMQRTAGSANGSSQFLARTFFVATRADWLAWIGPGDQDGLVPGHGVEKRAARGPLVAKGSRTKLDH